MNLTRTLGTCSALALAATTALAGGGTARVQVIHNSADAAASSVDVWLDNTLLLDDFTFRTASPFVDAPAGIPFTVGIAPASSASAAESIYTETFTLTAGATYVIVASGIVSPTGYDPATPFSLSVFAAGQEAAGTPTNTDVLVFHGCTDAPTVDVFESAVLGATAVDNASYGDFAGYLGLPTADYTIQVRDAAQTTIVATYAAPLATLGLEGAALVVVASGFLNPEVNSQGPGFGLWVALPSGGPLVELPQLSNPSARLQVVHNCADLAASSVDVYVNGALLLDNFAFRTASPFIDAPATLDLEVAVAPPNSASAADAIFTQVFNLVDGGSYIVIASGIVSGSGYNPSPGFALVPTIGARESATNPANTDVVVYHGSTDAPIVDVFESAVLSATAADDLAYGSYTGYLELPTADYVVQVRDADQTTIVATYAAPLATLNLQGAALAVIASGFLSPALNSGGPAFGLWVALPSGGPLVELPLLPNPTARVQVIHNSADAAASSVDVWLNNTLLVDNFAFRTATPFVDAPATIAFTVGIAPPNSTSASESIATFTYTLDEDATYIITANGIVSGSGYNPATPFDLYVNGTAREAAQTAGNTDILVFHGCTDAPVVDVAETAVVNGTVVDDLAYGSYDGYLEVPTNDYVLQVQLSDGTPVVSYQAPLATLGLNNAALTVLASGFLDPAQNSGGPAFGLWVALAGGGPLVELPLFTGVNEAANVASINAWPNPASDVLTVDVTSIRDARSTLMIVDAAGRVVADLGNAPVQQAGNLLTLPVSDLAAGSYQLSFINAQGRNNIPFQIVR